jgi:hypothetical protein
MIKNSKRLEQETRATCVGKLFCLPETLIRLFFGSERKKKAISRATAPLPNKKFIKLATACCATFSVQETKLNLEKEKRNGDKR